MKILISLILLTVCTIFIPSGGLQLPDDSTNKFSLFISELTYERVFHDNIWWIVVYQDGMKINEYPDIDAM